jgi:hypothetical protein
MFGWLASLSRAQRRMLAEVSQRNNVRSPERVLLRYVQNRIRSPTRASGSRVATWTVGSAHTRLTVAEELLTFVQPFSVDRPGVRLAAVRVV